MSLKQRILTISESAERNHFFELRAIAMEVRKMEDRVNQLDEELERTKQDRNAIAKTVREPLLLKLDHANEHIKQLEEAGDYLCAAAAFMGWHDKIETWNKAKEAKL